MVKLSISSFFIGGTILLLTSYTFAALEEDIYEMTAMSLTFLKAHEDRVAAHEAKEVDETHKQNFIDTWTDPLSAEMVKDIMNRIEKDWRYTLDLINSNDNDTTALVLALFSKIETYTQGWYYDSCIVYAMLMSTNGYKPEHCRKLTAFLSLYSVTSINELVQKFLSVTDGSLSNGNPNITPSVTSNLLFLLIIFIVTRKFSAPDDSLVLQEFVSVLTSHTALGLYFTLKPGIYSAPDNYEFLRSKNDAIFDIALEGERISKKNIYKQLENLKLSIVFGHLEKAVREEGLVHFVLNPNYLKALWYRGKDLSNWLISDNLTDSEHEKPTIMDLMCEVLIQKAEIWGVDRRNELESIKHTNVKIFLNEGVFTKTIE